MGNRWKNVISYINNSLQCASIMATGDLLGQTLIEKRPVNRIDVQRTIKYASLGALYIGPVLKWWYQFLERKIPTMKSVWKRTAMKISFDQTIMAPTLNLTAMVFTAKVMHHENRQQIIERVQRDYLRVMKANYSLWPAVQCINFSIIPLKYQVVFVQFIALIWNCFLSPILFSQQPQQQQEQEQKQKQHQKDE